MKPFCIALLLLTSFPSYAEDGLGFEPITRFIWSWTGPGVDTKARFEGDGSLLLQNGARGTWKPTAPSEIEVSFPPHPPRGLRFDPGLGRFAETGAAGAPLAGKRERAVPASAPGSPSPGEAPAQNAPRPTETHATFQGMALARDWLPERLGIDQKYTEDLRFYAQRVIAGEPRGAETTPKVIWGNLKWLMPVDEAIKSFGNVSAVSSAQIKNQSYPHHSLTLHGFNARVGDLGYQFNRVYLISDAKGQLVSVQFVAQAPKVKVWLPHPVEDRNPVYDLVNVKRNASTGNQVSFQIVPAGAGVKMVKLVLRKPLVRMDFPPGFAPPQMEAVPIDMKWLEDSHWYLPAPLAARFIEIADKALQR